MTVVLLLALPGCGGGPDPEPAQPVFREQGDLPALEARGYLRILTTPQRLERLERRGLSVDQDLRVAEKLAATLGLKPMVIRMKDRSEMLAALLDGRGDVVIARLTRTPLREKTYDFTVPTDRVHEMLVIRRGITEINTLRDLDGLEVAVRASSSFHETLNGIRQTVPGLKIRLLPEELDTEEILYRVHQGELQATVADEDMVRETAGYMPGLYGALKLTRKRPIAWALRKGNPKLRNAINAFLHQEAFTGDIPEIALGDLAAIRDRQVLRVLTKNTSATYFMHRGEQVGFEYELVRELADSLGLRLQMIVPPRGDLLVPWLLEGRGDLIAAAMTITPERARQVRFSHPYREETEQVVQRISDEALTAPEDLAGRAVVVRKSSSYRVYLEKLQDEVDLRIIDAPEEMETEELIAGVARGKYDLTVADRSILEIELQYRDDIHGPLTIGEPGRLAWAVRKDNENFLYEVNLFLDQHYRGTLFNILENKYFGSARRLVRRVEPNPASDTGLSPYDHLFKKHGREHRLDWRLLAAQAYQESRFDPEAESWAGAVGIMQVMPETAEELGVSGDLTDPEVGIEAGARYLRWLVDRFRSEGLNGAEPLRFALGAYNAGRGHVLDGRRIASATGKDPDRWFHNVEQAMLLLRKPEFASMARFGYCRGEQPMNYVRDITDRYLSYTQIAD